MLVRELVARLRELGCQPVRSSGSSHEVWSTSGGVMLVLVVKHRADHVSQAVLKTCVRTLRREGLEL